MRRSALVGRLLGATTFSSDGNGAAHRREIIVAVALVGDAFVALMKFAAAYATGSSAMFAEGMHSVMDGVTEAALLYGVLASRRPATSHHQLGFGREIFFWSFVAALLIFAAGAGSAMHDGVMQIMAPQPITNARISYSVLFSALVVEVACTGFALCHAAGSTKPNVLVNYVRSTRDSASLTILFGGAAGIVGLFLAATGIGLGMLFDQPSLDGMASIGIATLLALTAVVLAAQGRSLLIGLAASPAKVRAIKELAASVEGIEAVNGAITVQLSPDQILVALSLAMTPAMRTADIEDAVVLLDVAMKTKHPEIAALLVKPQSRQHYADLGADHIW
ncbi:cation diffusion facilitator family transporter [Bosea sp. TAB14]|uniref:cation diffusion facilitator family transporter n=1 Tax=Bosea sp. TAB14 TaxID=3237481 RepID=UPI003F9262FC